jgi:hypothetical protein
MCTRIYAQILIMCKTMLAHGRTASKTVDKTEPSMEGGKDPNL